MNESVFSEALKLAEDTNPLALNDLKFIAETWFDIQRQVPQDRGFEYQSRILRLISKAK